MLTRAWRISVSTGPFLFCIIMEYMKQAEAGTNRIFFACAVPSEVGKRLLLHLENLPIQLYPPENLHITLKFVGNSTQEETNIVSEAASQIAAEFPPFEVACNSYQIVNGRLKLVLRESKTFRRLFDILTMVLQKYTIGNRELHAFDPHITLGRVPESFLAESIKTAPQETFAVSKFALYKSEPGAEGIGEYTELARYALSGSVMEHLTYKTIVLPTRPQPDTLVAIFILKKFGEDRFPGIKEAEVDVWQTIPDGATEQNLDTKGVLLIDIGGGRFDHHAAKEQTTASNLIASYLGVLENLALAKLLAYARRDDFYGKGTISTDTLDRAFGLSALVANVNKVLAKEPERVVEVFMPLLVAHYKEEVRRTEEMPREFEEKMRTGRAEIFEVRQRGKKLKVVIVESDNASLPGYLRSQLGGKFDVVAQWLPSGHVNILTRPAKHISLSMLAALIRSEEAVRSGTDIEMNESDLMKSGRMAAIPEWYYDPATNSLQNGGINPKDISPTHISKSDFKNMLIVGLSESGFNAEE